MHYRLVGAAWTLYGGEPLKTRAHVVCRVLTCPFEALLSRFPVEGAVLDIGCGHGLLLNLLALDQSRSRLLLQGVDHDGAKIERARRIGGARVDFSSRDLASFADASFDFLSIIDVLYAVKRHIWEEILGHCFRLLRPGGRLLVKEVVDRPRWKYWAIMAQETVSVRLVGLTKGDRPHIEAAETYRAAISGAGFTVIEETPLASATWVSHYLYVGEKN